MHRRAAPRRLDGTNSKRCPIVTLFWARVTVSSCFLASNRQLLIFGMAAYLAKLFTGSKVTLTIVAVSTAAQNVLDLWTAAYDDSFGDSKRQLGFAISLSIQMAIILAAACLEDVTGETKVL